MEDERRCVLCLCVYNENKNVGLHLCRIHPGVVMHCIKRGTHYYSCCGCTDTFNTHGHTGCLAIDHLSKQMSVTSESERLHDLHAFCVTAVIASRLERAPFLENVIYDSRRGTPSCPLRLDCAVFGAVARNHTTLQGYHTASLFGADRSTLAPQTASIELNLARITESVLAQVKPAVERGDGWVHPDDKWRDLVPTQHQGRDKSVLPAFLVVRRIGMSLNDSGVQRFLRQQRQ